MESGIYYEMSEQDYHSLHYLSSSGIRDFAKSPKKFRYWHGKNTKKSQALIDGQIVHQMTLQPEKGTPDVKPDRGQMYFDMVTAVWAHENAANYLKQSERFEAVGIFKFPGTEVVCRVRSDALCPALDALVDLKTTRNASPMGFAREVNTYRLDLQAAFYLVGWQTLGINFADFILIAIEKVPPYEVGVYRLDDRDIQKAKAELLDLVYRYEECVRENKWPGIPQEVLTISRNGYQQLGDDENEQSNADW